MTFHVDPLLTLISDCEATTGWSGGSLNDSFGLEGVYCLGEKVSETTGSENVFTFAANVDMTNQFFIIPMSITGLADTLANGGYRIIVVDGNADTWTYYVGGSDTTNERWTYFTVDPSEIPDFLGGVANSAKAVTSITGTGTTKTCTTSAAHGMATNDWVKISGANVAAFNGNFSITVTGASTFTYISTASTSPAGGTIILNQIPAFDDIDGVGVQMKVVTKAVGNTPNAFWDICRYGNGLIITSIIDTGAHTITRSGTTCSFATATVLDETVDSSSITFTAPSTISDSNNGFGIYKIHDKIKVAGATTGGNNITYRVATVSAGTITVEETSITTQASTNNSVSMTRVHDMEDGDRVTISDASPSTYNGTYRVTNVNADKTTFDYVVPTAPASSPATGSSILCAPATTWEKIAAVDAANYYGICVRSGGVNFLQGQIVLGSLSAGTQNDLYFNDENFLCVFKDNIFLPFGRNNILTSKGNTGDIVSISMKDGFIGANASTWAWATTLGSFSPTAIVMNGITFSDFTTLVCSDTSAHIYQNCKIVNYNQIQPQGSTWVNTAFSSALTGSLGLIWPNTVNFSDATFAGGSSTGYYVTITQTTTQNFDNMVFDDGVSAADVLLINGGTSITVNNLNGSNANSYVSSPSGVVTFASAVTHTVTNLRTNDRVIWIRVSDGVELENLLETSGSAAYTYNYTGDVDVYVQVLSGDNTRKNTVTTVTLGSINAGFPATQAVDNVYFNP